MPHGGARVGAGRKRKTDAERWLEGKSGRKTGQAGAGATIAAPTVVTPPDGLDVAVRAVWLALAPHALSEKTLTPATAAAFEDLCASIVLRRLMLTQIAEQGLTTPRETVDEAGNHRIEHRAHALLGHQRAMLQRIESGMAKFRLAPMGKALEVPVPADERDEWDDMLAQGPAH